MKKEWKEIIENCNNNWYHISVYQNLSEDFIEEFQDKFNWYYISIHQNLSEDFIREFQDKVDWYYISGYQNLSEDFIREFQDKVSWYYISVYQNLSEDFIEEFQDKFNWYCISVYQNLSEDFIEKHKDNLYIYLINNKNKYHISIQEYAEKFNLEIDDEYLYAYRNHNKCGNGTHKNNSFYVPYMYYKDWHCDTNPMNNASYGFGIWPEGNTKVRVKLEDWGTCVHNDKNGKARVWGFEIIS